MNVILDMENVGMNNLDVNKMKVIFDIANVSTYHSYFVENFYRQHQAYFRCKHGYHGEDSLQSHITLCSKEGKRKNKSNSPERNCTGISKGD
jgi:hypothetical protein